jgi:hypothetical protein
MAQITFRLNAGAQQTLDFSDALLAYLATKYPSVKAFLRDALAAQTRRALREHMEGVTPTQQATFDAQLEAALEQERVTKEVEMGDVT